MRTNYIEYHLRLQQDQPEQGKLFAEEYPDLLSPVQQASQDEEFLCGVEDQPRAQINEAAHATSVAQTIFNVVRQSNPATLPSSNPLSQGLRCLVHGCRLTFSLGWDSYQLPMP